MSTSTRLDALADRTPPLLALVVAVAAVSTSAVLVRWTSAPSAVTAFYRVLFTTLLLVPLAATRYGAAFRRLAPRDGLIAAVTGVALAIHFAAWFESLRWTSIAASVTLVQAQPAFVAVGAWLLLDERVDARTALGVAVALGGMALLSAGDLVSGAVVTGRRPLYGMALLSAGDLVSGAVVTGRRPLYGNALAVLGAAAAAAYVLVGRSLRQRVPLLPYVTVVYAACTLALLVFVVAGALGDAAGGGTAAGRIAASLFDHPPQDWVLFLAMAVGPGLLGHTVVNWALAHVESSVVSVSLLGEPVGATLLGVVLLDERVGAVTLVGGAIILAGVALTAQARETDAGADGEPAGPHGDEPPDAVER
ncbi:DMT family transporter [Haloglomus litoreum]|uniref:DMT family transporter n=1 Tax=Haloglomus litoreum TaxID=3034026 RepID=UPI0023E77173|nr:DMT family transporter [Haloglomus sp. DT116]